MYRPIMAILIVLGAVYVVLHLWVTYAAFVDAGWLAGVATFFTLGFGDAYWAWAWWNRPDIPNEANGAFIAAILAFISWGTRPWFRPYLFKLAVEHATRDQEVFTDVSPNRHTRPKSSPGASDIGHGGGAA